MDTKTNLLEMDSLPDTTVAAHHTAHHWSAGVLASFSELIDENRKTPGRAQRQSFPVQPEMGENIQESQIPEFLLALPLSRENAFKLLICVEQNPEVLRAVRSGLALGTLGADSVKGMVIDRIMAARLRRMQH